jgi:hypothetical protein
MLRGSSDPRRVRVGGDPGQVHSAGIEFEDEQDVEPAEKHRVDGAEVTGQHARCLGAPERRPARSGPSRGRPQSVGAQRLGHRARGHPDAALAELAGDPG